jgi:hypothetical protein
MYQPIIDWVVEAYRRTVTEKKVQPEFFVHLRRAIQVGGARKFSHQQNGVE